jgi:hypothetical protein
MQRRNEKDEAKNAKKSASGFSLRSFCFLRASALRLFVVVLVRNVDATR